MSSQPISQPEAEKILYRIFRAGELRHLPKSRRDTELLVALAAAYLDPRSTYSESEINTEIEEWMAGFTNSVTLDHVTFRRYMVDYHLVRRDANGENYRTNQMVLNSFISPEARSVQPSEMLKAAEADRIARRAAAQSRSGEEG